MSRDPLILDSLQVLSDRGASASAENIVKKWYIGLIVPQSATRSWPEKTLTKSYTPTHPRRTGEYQRMPTIIGIYHEQAHASV